MEKYFYVFFPTINALGEVNKSIILISMLAFIGITIIYIILGMENLIRILKNKDGSLKQSSYIIFKILFMLLLVYLDYEIAIIIFKIS